MCDLRLARQMRPQRIGLTYGQLDAALRALGFTVGEFVHDSRVYKHLRSGALIVFPILPNGQPVRPHHLVATRMTLDGFGIAAPPELAAQLQAS
jgi:hypothetical protein